MTRLDTPARFTGRGRASGAVVDAVMAHVWTFEQGRPIRLRQFLDRTAALEAAGLQPPAVP
jgi:ketosteroid isomerase-like protein